jgi:hypothetical protein
MTTYAWANPTNGVREQDPDIRSAVARIRAELADPKAAGLHSVVLYQQEPRIQVESGNVTTVISPKWHKRLADRIRLGFVRTRKAADESAQWWGKN